MTGQPLMSHRLLPLHSPLWLPRALLVTHDFELIYLIFFYIYLGIKLVASHPRSRAMHDGFSVLYDVMYYY